MKQANTKPAQSLVASTIPASWQALRVVLSVLAGCLLMCVCAALVRIPVPGTDVPMTLQLLAVLLVGFSMSPGRAAAAMALYVACGAAGLPVFAGGGLTGSTGGYILAFVPAAWSVSTLKGIGSAGYVQLLLAGAIGTIIVFALGLAWRIGLALMLQPAGDLVWPAIATGISPFALKAVVELLLAVTGAVILRSTLERRNRRRFVST